MKKIILIIAILVSVVLYGFWTSHTDGEELPLGGSVDLLWYGGRYLGSDIAIPGYPKLGRLVLIGEYKYQAIACVLAASALALIMMSRKKIV